MLSSLSKNKYIISPLVICILLVSISLSVSQKAFAQVYTTTLTGPKQVPPNTSPGTGTESVTLMSDGKTGQINLSFTGLLGTEVNAHIHGPAAQGDQNAIQVIIPLGSTINNYMVTFTAQQVQWLQSGLMYADVHSSIYPDGEIRGQLAAGAGATLTPVPTTGTTVTPIPTIGATTTPIPTSGPTATIIPGHTIFSISICPHGLGNCGDNVSKTSGGNKTPKHTQENVTVTVLNNTGQTVATQQGTVVYNAAAAMYSGNIDMGSLASGVYLVKLKMNEFLSAQLTGIISVTAGSTSTLPTISAVTGDINNDNKVDILDYNIIVSCYGTKQNTPSCLMPPNAQSTGADINDDGVIDGTDYNLFIRELSVQSGA